MIGKSDPIVLIPEGCAVVDEKAPEQPAGARSDRNPGDGGKRGQQDRFADQDGTDLPWRSARALEDAQLMQRRINKKTVYQALSITMLAIAIVVVSTLCVFFYSGETVSPLDCLYETVSAFATVGCSVGVTATMQAPALIVTILTMFIGRVGPISMVISLARQNQKKGRFAVLPEGKINVG